MDISEELVENVKETIDNPKDKIKLNRLYLLYKLYKNTKPKKITYRMIEESLNRINTKFKKSMNGYNDSEEAKNMLNKVISINYAFKENKNSKKSLDSLLYDLTCLECELLIIPTFPSYLESVLKEKLKEYNSRKLARGRR